MVAMVDDWNAWRLEHPVEQTLMLVHGTNDDVDTVNILAQARRAEAEDLGRQSIAALDRNYRLHVGDVIVVRGAPLYARCDGRAERIENGTILRITAVDDRRDRLGAWVSNRRGGGVRRV